MRATQRTEVRSSARQLAKICESCTQGSGESRPQPLVFCWAVVCGIWHGNKKKPTTNMSERAEAVVSIICVEGLCAFCLFSIKDTFKGPEFSQKITLSILNINVTHVSLPKMSALLLFATSFRKRKRALRVWKKALCDVIKQSTPLPGHSSSFFVSFQKLFKVQQSINSSR